MTQSPPPTPEALLQSGLAALKQGKPQQAVTLLSQLQTQPAASSPQKLKARIAMVRAYRALGQVAAAQTLCERLQRVSQPQVQQWATKTLAELADASGAVTPADPTGFRPLNAPTADGAAASDASGFVPLATDNDKLPPSPKSAPIAPKAPSAPKAPEVLALGAETLTPDVHAPQSPATSPPTPSSSLFHYQSLNQDPTADAALMTPAVADAPSAGTPGEVPAAPPSPEGDRRLDQPWQFRHADRLERLRQLPRQPIPWWQLGLTQAVTMVLLAVALVQLVALGLQVLIRIWVCIRWAFPALPPFVFLYQDYREWIVAASVALLLGSPWILEALLTRAYGQKKLSVANLRTHSPESARLLLRICQQRGWTVPALRIIPDSAPVILSYGWLPRYTRIVVSQGLLDCLEDDELATLYGYELSHLLTCTLPLASLVLLLLQGAYQGYWQAARFGDRQTVSLLTALGAAASAVCYGIFWLLRKVSILIARQRVATSDRYAVEWTGNPNGLIRALLKSAMAMADTIADTQQTPPLLESTDLLTPLSYQAVFSMGSLYPDADVPALLAWETQNPYRHWLNLNQSHPLLGDRLAVLTRYAAGWKLDLEMPALATSGALAKGIAPRFYWGTLLRQMSPYVGPCFGVAIALLFWFVGGVVNPLGWWWASWVSGDRSILIGSLWLGIGMGTLWRINTYFPDIVQSNRQDHPPLATLLAEPTAFPTDSTPLKLQGTLLGRRGIANWLCQDLILKTPNGALLKLHFLSMVGAFGNVLIHPGHPSEWVGQPMSILGWFRRSATTWLDIDRMIRPGQPPLPAQHAIWSLVLGLGFSCWGAYVIYQG